MKVLRKVNTCVLMLTNMYFENIIGEHISKKETERL